MPIAPHLALTTEERDAMLHDEWNMRIATVSPSGRVNLTPLWYVWHDDRVWAWCRGQKVENMRRDPRCTILVDRNVRFPELQGVMIQGDVRILEDEAAEADEPELEAVRRRYGRKYDGGHGEPARGPDAPLMAQSASGRTRRWIVVTPSRIVSWDNHKLG